MVWASVEIPHNQNLAAAREGEMFTRDGGAIVAWRSLVVMAGKKS